MNRGRETISIGTAINDYAESNFNGYKKTQQDRSPPPNWKWVLDVDSCLDLARALFDATNAKLEDRDKIRSSEYFNFRELVGILAGQVKKQGRDSLLIFEQGEKKYYKIVLEVSAFRERIMSNDTQHRDIREALTTLHQHPTGLFRFQNKEGWTKRRYEQIVGIEASLIDSSFFEPKY